MTGVILGIVASGISVIRRWDKPLRLDWRGYLWILMAAVLEGWSVRFLTTGEPGFSRALLSVLGGSLLLASVTDILQQQVYNFTWWPGMAAILLTSGGRLLSGMVPSVGKAISALFVFWLLQTLIFRRVYGRADYYAFCVCASGEAAEGMGLAGFLIHMLLAYILLFLIQALRRNINEKGNLRQPVPFLPYITAAFWITFFLAKIIVYIPLSFG